MYVYMRTYVSSSVESSWLLNVSLRRESLSPNMTGKIFGLICQYVCSRTNSYCTMCALCALCANLSALVEMFSKGVRISKVRFVRVRCFTPQK